MELNKSEIYREFVTEFKGKVYQSDDYIIFKTPWKMIPIQFPLQLKISLSTGEIIIGKESKPKTLGYLSHCEILLERMKLLYLIPIYTNIFIICGGKHQGIMTTNKRVADLFGKLLETIIENSDLK